MSKTPIEPADIREGDLVRFELKDGEDAYEWRQRQHPRSEHRMGTFYLLDRPKPSADLPTEPTLGWLTASESRGRRTPPDRELAVWSLHQDPDVSIQRNGGNCGIAARWVTAFTPATAVPTEALDRFRHLRDTRNLANRDVDTFLAAIDEANA